MPEPVSSRFMVIPPRHVRALQMLVSQRDRDQFGGIGVGALLEDDDVLTIEQIVQPLWERGLVEDLTHTEMGEPGRYFIRITRLGQQCLALGAMLREQRKMTDDERTWFQPVLSEPKTLRTRHDPNEEKEAIA